MKQMKMINPLKNKFKGKDIYVLASGSSMNYISKDFFENKITVGINRVCNFFKCDFTVTKDGEGFSSILQNSVNKNNTLVISKYQYGTRPRLNKIIDNAIYFDHFDKPGQQPQTQNISKDLNKLIVSHSTVTSGIHFAAFLGAKNIIICGHDGGTIDGESTIKDYYKELQPHQRTMPRYNDWLRSIKIHTTDVCKKIKEEYNSNIYTINPFLFLDLEGHIYK